MFQWIGSALVQIKWLVAYSVPSHYLNQFWDIVNWTLRKKLQWNFNQNTKLFIHKLHMKIPSAKWRPFCLGWDELKSSARYLPFCWGLNAGRDGTPMYAMSTHWQCPLWALSMCGHCSNICFVLPPGYILLPWAEWGLSECYGYAWYIIGHL